MRARLQTAFLASLLAASPLLAQKTWVVDAANGPGTDFIKLADAIKAAKDGDLVRIRSGRYVGPDQLTKALGQSVSVQDRIGDDGGVTGTKGGKGHMLVV